MLWVVRVVMCVLYLVCCVVFCVAWHVVFNKDFVRLIKCHTSIDDSFSNLSNNFFLLLLNFFFIYSFIHLFTSIHSSSIHSSTFHYPNIHLFIRPFISSPIRFFIHRTVSLLSTWHARRTEYLWLNFYSDTSQTPTCLPL